MENVIISNSEEFEKKKKEFVKGTLKKIHVLADFDETLTKAFVDGKKVPSIISILRDYDYLDENYSKKAKALAKFYKKIEKDSSVPYEEKKEAMRDWWTKHFDLLIDSKLNKSHLKRIVKEEKIHFREGIPEFLDFLNIQKVPLVIISSSGVGEVIPMLLKKQNRLYDNISIVTNLYQWDSKGNAVSVKKPFIHSGNKDETSIKNFKFYDKIKNRKNVLLLGNSLEDLRMIKGLNYDNLIKIGFLNEKIEDYLNSYKNNFDVVITHDGNFDWINNFIIKI